jgi:hypothetical protein
MTAGFIVAQSAINPAVTDRRYSGLLAFTEALD